MGWVFLTNAVSLNSLITFGSGWNNVNLSSIVPIGTKAVILHVRNTGGPNYECNFRPYGSSEARLGWLSGSYHHQFIVPVNTDRMISSHCPNSAFAVTLVAYNSTDSFFMTSIENKCASTNIYTDKNVSASVPAGVVAAWFELNYYGTSSNAARWAIRPNGSSYDKYSGVATSWNISCLAFSGLDTDRVFELEVGDIRTGAYLWGYDENAFALTSPVTKTPTGTGSWVDIDVSGQVSVGAVGVVLDVEFPTLTTPYCNFRKKGSTDEDTTSISIPGLAWHKHWVVGLDENRVFQAYVSSTSIVFNVLGYVEGGGDALTLTRNFPVPLPETATFWQSQSGKRKFPL